MVRSYTESTKGDGNARRQPPAMLDSFNAIELTQPEFPRGSALRRKHSRVCLPMDGSIRDAVPMARLTIDHPLSGGLLCETATSRSATIAGGNRNTKYHRTVRYMARSEPKVSAIWPSTIANNCCQRYTGLVADDGHSISTRGGTRFCAGPCGLGGRPDRRFGRGVELWDIRGHEGCNASWWLRP